MFFQDRKKTREVQNFVLKVVNNNCPELKALFEGPRRDKRANLTLVVLVVPLEDGKLQANDAFFAITQELSITGVGIILDRQRSLDEVILGFRLGADLTYVRAAAKHLSPMGGGFFHLGLEMTEIVHQGDYPQLEKLIF
ncbi:MAG: hypothetical protein ABSA26_03190 [Thermoguttaceae bacterium]